MAAVRAGAARCVTGGRAGFERAAEFVHEVLAVGQAGDRVLVQLQLQGFDLGVLFLGAGVDAFAGLVERLHHVGQFRHARFHLPRRRVLADAADVVADLAQQPVLDPADQREGEQRPDQARAQHQRDHAQAAAPQGFPGVGVVGHQRHLADLAPAVADGVRGRARVQRRQGAEPGGHRGGGGGRLAFDQHLAFRIGQAHQREVAAVVQRRHQQFLHHRVVVGRLRQRQRQRHGGVGGLHLQLARQVFAGGVDAERQGAQQDDADRESDAEQELSKYGHSLVVPDVRGVCLPVPCVGVDRASG